MRRHTARHETNLTQGERVSHLQCGAEVTVMDRVEGPAENPNHVRYRSAAHMAVSEHDEFLRRQSFQTDRTTGMKLVGADADFRA